MKKVAVIGHFGVGHIFLDGQTVKTKIITNELQRQLGEEQVLKIDTHGGAKTLLKAPLQVFCALKSSENVLIFPAHNGLRVYAPLLSLLRRFYKNRKLHYVVIGGWLPRFLIGRKGLAKTLKRFDGIYVETQSMKKALGEQGFTNVHVVPNCKDLTVLAEGDLIYPMEAPYKLCTFSRVMKEKGIEDAVYAVKEVNDTLGYQAFSLDIYGQIDAGQTEWFESLQKAFPEYIRYGGCIPYDKSVEVLKEYCALLFPTHYYTEGIPGTIIDAYAAGIPVISAKWQNFNDVIDEGITGVGYEFGHIDELTHQLNEIARNAERINAMKQNCLQKRYEFFPCNAIGAIINNLS